MIKFYVTTSDKFTALSPKDADALYFLTDTHQIYKGSTLYTGKVELVSSFPTRGAEGVLYIAESNLEGRIWSGGAWVTVAKPYTETVTESSEDLPTAKAVATYVINKINEAIGGSATLVSGVTYSATNAPDNGKEYDERDLVVQKSDGSTETIHLEKLVSSVEYDKAALTLTFRLSCVNDPIVVNLPQDNFITGGQYNPQTKNIELSLKDGSTILIPAGDLVDIYTGGSTSTVTVSVSSGNQITATVKVSSVAGNTLTAQSDGLYVAAPDLSGKLDKLGAGTADEIITSTADGSIKRSGKTAGGSTIAASPNANTLATEIAVNAVREALQGSINTLNTSLGNKVDTANITQTLNAATPSAAKIPSEAAVVSALSWQAIE